MRTNERGSKASSEASLQWAGSSGRTAKRRRHERSWGKLGGKTRESQGVRGSLTVLVSIIEQGSQVQTIPWLQRNSDLIGLNWKIVFNQI